MLGWNFGTMQVYDLFTKLVRYPSFLTEHYDWNSMTQEVALNALGQPLVPCSFDPLTGFFRDGCCKTDSNDLGRHLVCAIVNDAFLQFSLEKGNDLITPRPEFAFPGLVPGDQWCLCISRWAEAYEAGCAPRIKLESTHINALKTVSLEILEQFSVIE